MEVRRLMSPFSSSYLSFHRLTTHLSPQSGSETRNIITILAFHFYVVYHIIGSKSQAASLTSSLHPFLPPPARQGHSTMSRITSSTSTTTSTSSIIPWRWWG
ncbi:hypothetical protein E2C01_037679 [Portunus trituberculatus]|uniref:Uncharacterized protein n=1 Tax=Portunus trituberculatus TaxID=210409 RepID=A0A5B7F8R7_PORTR|nr:hypothetical protein [Portunus trituberculatus]